MTGHCLGELGPEKSRIFRHFAGVDVYLITHLLRAVKNEDG